MSKTKRSLIGLENWHEQAIRKQYAPRNFFSALYHRHNVHHDGWQDSSGAGGHQNTAKMHKICVRILRRKLKVEAAREIESSLIEGL